MKRNKLYILQCLLAVLFLLPSCANDDEDGGESVSGDKITLRLSPLKNNNLRSAYEDGVANENTILTLDIFIYRQGSSDCAYYERVSFSPGLTGTQEHEVVLGATQEMFLSMQTYFLYVVANYSGTVPAEGLSWEDLHGLVEGPLDADHNQTSFLMDASAIEVLNDGELVVKHIPIKLRRAASKIRTTLSYDNNLKPMNNIGITKKLINYATNVPVLEEGYAIEPELTNTELTKQEYGAGNANHIILYSYPNDWNKDVSKETYLIINAPVKIDKTEYANNYYKVPVNYRLPENNDNTTFTPEEEEARQALYKLQRNYLYDIIVNIDKLGSETIEGAVELTVAYRIEDWTTREVIVEVEGVNYLYVRDTDIRMLNTTAFTTVFQSSSDVLTISDITINETSIENGEEGVEITWTPNVTSGEINISSSLPANFVPRKIKFTVSNGDGLTQEVTVTQYPNIYLTSDISADEPAGESGQNNRNMYIITSLTANFSLLPDPDEFDEDFGGGYVHIDPDPALGHSYAEYIRQNGVLGYPLLDSNGMTIDSEENNRRISPRFMLASQFGAVQSTTYVNAQEKCLNYVERDETTGETYDDWRLPTLAETYLIDVLQNIEASEVKKILEGKYYWSARASEAVKFMDPRVLVATSTPYNGAFRCVRDVKN